MKRKGKKHKGHKNAVTVVASLLPVSKDVEEVEQLYGLPPLKGLSDKQIQAGRYTRANFYRAAVEHWTAHPDDIAFIEYMKTARGFSAGQFLDTRDPVLGASCARAKKAARNLSVKAKRKYSGPLINEDAKTVIKTDVAKPNNWKLTISKGYVDKGWA